MFPEKKEDPTDKPNSEKVFDLEYFFELSPDLICIAGYDGYFRKINPAVSKTLGYTNEELMSRPINSFVHPEDQGMTNNSRNNVRSGKHLINFENRYMTKNGETVWLSWTSIPIERDKTIFAIAKNISAKKKPAEKPLHTENHEQIASTSDKVWLQEFENLIRKNAGKSDLNIQNISDELAISERQLHRRIKSLLNLTPNAFIRQIRLQIAKEAIESGKYRTISEVAYASGFETPSYFRKLFKQINGYDINDML
ncbi:PAS domain S-box protein [Pedobacter sp. MC2016-24]|uniref:PAS domain S-box protein n=1 Tax=Pedobacter sp. MC2016-24 TaxID=2780090 RepID=UPI00187E5663|nr:PAS domain S-box protein [Pedobacter sp. MC2016-24]MBE9599593.1 PAS domain S-box protein [Pedobacter sp. MC2016-24]